MSRTSAFLVTVAVVLLALTANTAALKTSGAQGKIEHVVVLMLENRAFSHMCGWLGRWIPGVDGLTGREFNTANGTRYYVQDQCPYVHPFDPIHSVEGTTSELMDIFDDPSAWINPEPMSGFAETHFRNKDPEFWTVMHGFKPEAVPAISTLAKNFAVFDRWYASLPGPTWPNRAFFHSGTSHGMTSNTIIDYAPGLPQRTIYDVLNDHNISWGAYYQDVTDLVLFKSMRELKNLERMHEWSLFAEHAAKGELPAFSWVTPRFFPWVDAPASDQHPSHDVRLGEEVIAEVYATLRNSPKFNSTLLLITYDEHGGFYDTIPPPMTNVPNPDGINAASGFNFTRLGVRICTVAVSPLIPAGTVIHEPADAPASRYEHGSTFATLRQLFGLTEELTNRTAFAAPFDHILSLSTPRTDCPTSVPVPTDTAEGRLAMHAAEMAAKPNDLQKFFYGVLEMALGTPAEQLTEGRQHETQLSMAGAIRNMMKRLLNF